MGDDSAFYLDFRFAFKLIQCMEFCSVFPGSRPERQQIPDCAYPHSCEKGFCCFSRSFKSVYRYSDFRDEHSPDRLYRHGSGQNCQSGNCNFKAEPHYQHTDKSDDEPYPVGDIVIPEKQLWSVIYNGIKEVVQHNPEIASELFWIQKIIYDSHKQKY